MIILLAFDAVCRARKKDIGEVVPPRLVLTEHLPENLDKKAVNEILNDCIPAQLQRTCVSCVQFVDLRGPLARYEILQLAERHAGSLFYSGYPHQTLFLPVTHSELAAMVFHVKACAELQDTSHPNSAGKFLRPSVAWKDEQGL